MNNIQKIAIYFILIINFYLLFIIYRYWQADIYYNTNKIEKALVISPNEPLYVAKLDPFKALSLSPYNMNIRKILVNYLIENDKLKDAEQVLLDGIKFAPYNPELYYKLGLLQVKLSKYDQALLNFKKALYLKPNYTEVNDIIGKWYKK